MSNFRDFSELLGGVENPYVPKTPDNITRGIASIANCAEEIAKAARMPVITRELTLFVTMHEHSCVIDNLKELGVDSIGLYQELYRKYQRCVKYGYPYEGLSYMEQYMADRMAQNDRPDLMGHDEKKELGHDVFMYGYLEKCLMDRRLHAKLDERQVKKLGDYQILYAVIYGLRDLEPSSSEETPHIWTPELEHYLADPETIDAGDDVDIAPHPNLMRFFADMEQGRMPEDLSVYSVQSKAKSKKKDWSANSHMAAVDGKAKKSSPEKQPSKNDGPQ